MDLQRIIKKNGLLQQSTLIFAVILFLVICLFGSLSNAQSSILATGTDLDKKPFLQLLAIENDTDNCEFQIFYGSGACSALVFPQSTFHFNPQNALPLSNKDMAIIKCCKGSFLPVFIQHGDVASGDIQEGFDGPFYLSMWLAFPQVPETSKTHVRYLVTSGTTGTVGIKIGNRGDYRFVAYDNVHFIT